MENLQDRSFISVLEQAFGQKVSTLALEALSQPSSVSVRYNPSKPVEIPSEDKVLWNDFGRFLSERPVFTLDPLLHAGCYYVQDSSAMFVGSVARQAMKRFEGLSRPVRVLDLCAAPGGKTTDLAASLRMEFGENFILVANEVMRQRSTVLSDNVALWGDPNVVVTSVDPKAFASMEGFFDIIVADVPCSGEGMFRKDQQAVQEWSLDTVALCEARQRRIIADVWPSLSEGGVMVYSTCTFNVRENDGNVKWMVEALGAEPVDNDLEFEGVIRTELGYSLVPGLVRGEGQYCASAVKTSSQKAFSLQKPKQKKLSSKSGFENLLDPGMNFTQKGEFLLASPEIISLEIMAVSHLKPIRTGVLVGTLKGQTLVPDADLALCTGLSDKAFASAEVDRDTALSFLHRDTFTLPGVEKGFVVVRYSGHPLGFVKNLGNRCNNLHPASRRIRMDI